MNKGDFFIVGQRILEFDYSTTSLYYFFVRGEIGGEEHAISWYENLNKAIRISYTKKDLYKISNGRDVVHVIFFYEISDWYTVR